MMKKSYDFVDSNVQHKIGTGSFMNFFDVATKKRNKLLTGMRFACLQNWFALAAWFN
jgi:hypothetical protein